MRLVIFKTLSISKLSILLDNLVVSLGDFAANGFHVDVHFCSRGVVSPEGDQS